MFYFKGCDCSICQKRLKDTEEIVVCPICGTPYHRECYDSRGACIHEAEHASGYVYERVSKHFEEKAVSNAAQTIECMECKQKNSSANIFCSSCGTPLHAQKPHFTENKSDAETPDLPFMPGLPPIAQDDEIDGIAVRDWMEYTGNSGPYYIYQFKNMDTLRRKTSVCWSAIFFPPIYFFFRKLWAWGVLASIIMIGCNAPFLIKLLQDSGALALGFSNDALIQMNYIASVINTLMCVLSGMFAIYLYRQKSAKVIHKQKAAKEKPAYEAWLKKASGPSKIGVIIAVICYFVLASVFVNFVGAEYIMQLSMMM